MYDPIQDGKEKICGNFIYQQAKPPQELSDIVHSYWQLKTDIVLEYDFTLHAIPDACVNILFNQKDTNIAGITGLKTTYVELNLGRNFDYVGIQFFPGVWQGNSKEIKDCFIGDKYLGQLALIDVNIKTASLGFFDKLPVFTRLVSHLVDQNIIQKNNVIQKILSHLDCVHSVSEMANIACYSPRQLQRILKKTTGFSPHDFLKVIRLQQSLKEHNLDSYTDQSHFIHSFKKITGYTPTDYFRKYDV